MDAAKNATNLAEDADQGTRDASQACSPGVLLVLAGVIGRTLPSREILRAAMVIVEDDKHLPQSYHHSGCGTHEPEPGLVVPSAALVRHDRKPFATQDAPRAAPKACAQLGQVGSLPDATTSTSPSSVLRTQPQRSSSLGSGLAYSGCCATGLRRSTTSKPSGNSKSLGSGSARLTSVSVKTCLPTEGLTTSE